MPELPDPPSHAQVKVTREAFDRRQVRMYVVAVAVILGVSLGVVGSLLMLRPAKAPILTPEAQFITLEKQAAARGCVVFTTVQGATTPQQASAILRELDASSGPDTAKQTSTQEIVGTIKVQGQTVYVVAAATEACDFSAPTGGGS